MPGKLILLSKAPCWRGLVATDRVVLNNPFRPDPRHSLKGRRHKDAAAHRSINRTIKVVSAHMKALQCSRLMTYREEISAEIGNPINVKVVILKPDIMESI